MKKRIFLGGTCNGSLWRNQIIPKLKIDFFNPVVEDWTPECQEEEIRQREECDYCSTGILVDGVCSNPDCDSNN